MNSLLALGARAITMVVSLVCGVLTTRLVIGTSGVEYYALYTVLIGLPSLLSFSDMGSGAILVNSIATDDDFRSRPRVVGQLRSVWRIMLVFAATTMALNTLLLTTGGWRLLLGTPGELDAAPLAAFVTMTIFCLAIPLGVWTRIILGLRRNHIIILVQGLISPLTLACVWLLLHVPSEHVYPFLAAGSFFATAVVGLIGFLIAGRASRPLLRDAARGLLRPRRAPGSPVMHVGWPMLAQLISPPIAVSTQRLVVAQFGTHQQVAEYGVVGQVFFAIQGLVMAAGTALWPLYARRRHLGTLQRGPAMSSLVFGSAVAAATVCVWLSGPWLFGFISAGQLEISTSTILAFGLMITCIAALSPLGMFLMEPAGIRFQVIPTLTMAFLSLGLAIALTPVLGTAGPPLANAFAVITCQIIPFSLYIHRHRERLRSGESHADAPQDTATPAP